MILSNARLVGPRGVRDGWLDVQGARIAATGSGMPPAPGRDLDGRYVLPGLVDMHVHGGGGTSFADDPHAVAAFHRRHGTTTSVASLLTAPFDELARQIRALAPLVADGTLAGIHLEGPFLAAARCGAHDPDLLRLPTREAVAELLDAGGGAVRMVTIAPELPGAIDAIEQIVAAGAVAALGHTDARYAQARAALAAGATVATHLFNAMRPLHHRDPGVIAALLDSDATVEVILDNVHVDPDLVRWVLTRAAPGRVALVTDAMAAAGMGDGDYLLGRLAVRVRDGVARLAEGDSIAGSTLTMDAALRNAVATGVPLADAVAALTTVPAAALGLDAGRLDAGCCADLLVLGDDLAVESVMYRGEWVR